MTLSEFSNEFEVTYNEASMGAPALNNYEKSLFLTQAVRDLVAELYKNFEYTEFAKRALAPLIKEQSLPLNISTDYFKDTVVTEATLPTDLYFILQENAKVKDNCNDIEVISEDLDTLNKTMKNPFKKPNKRKILRTQISNTKVRLYSTDIITNFKIKYIKKYTPIILSNFTTDPELIGDETIDGLAIPTTTELPDLVHHLIVKRAVVLAIKSFRENTLKTQIEV